MTRGVSTLLRLEGLAALGLGLALYARLEGSWLLFALLFLVPDLSMVGYLKDVGVGARAYNVAHTYVAPALLGVVAWWTGSVVTGEVALIWVSHIGIDRLLGFGLKYPSGFRDTHLGVLE